jgi:hypothetical protein
MAGVPSGALAGALARKYRALVALRARRDGGGAAATRDELRALAAEFPGCLRELDTLGPAELERRAAACTAADAGGGRVPPDEPWMAWIAAYHALMRDALAERAGGRQSRGSSTESPGRLNVVVLRELGARFGVPPATIAATLFPVRRPSPYRL